MHCWQECKSVQPVAVENRCLKKRTTELPYAPATRLLEPVGGTAHEQRIPERAGAGLALHPQCLPPASLPAHTHFPSSASPTPRASPLVCFAAQPVRGPPPGGLFPLRSVQISHEPWGTAQMPLPTAAVPAPHLGITTELSLSLSLRSITDA